MINKLRNFSGFRPLRFITLQCVAAIEGFADLMSFFHSFFTLKDLPKNSRFRFLVIQLIGFLRSHMYSILSFSPYFLNIMFGLC